VALTLNDAITQVRYALNEILPAFWTDTEITAWIQEGTRNFSSKSLMYESSEDISPVEDQIIYVTGNEAWIANLLEAYAFIYDDGSNNFSGMIKMNPKQLGHTSTFTKGTPKYYAIHGRAVYLWPVPDATAAASGNIIALVALETDDITDLADEFQHLPILYATAKAKQKDGRYQEAQALFKQFNTELNFERDDKHVREVDSFDNFNIPKGSGQGGAGGGGR